MKEIYIIEPNEQNLKDLENVFQNIDPTKEKYRKIINPFNESKARTTTLQEVLSLTNSGSLDLMVLPINLGMPKRAFGQLSRKEVEELEGVKIAKDYKSQGYKGFVVLTMGGYYEFALEQNIIEAGREDSPEGKSDSDLAIHAFCERDYLNLYSHNLPRKSKEFKLLEALEGDQHIELIGLK